jgi:hypothetical protein
MARLWPDLAENLINGRFVPSVRDMQTITEVREIVGHRLTRLWGDALENELSRVVRRLSGGLIQLFFNLPVLGVLGYTGWLTVESFFEGNILSGDFFLHAFWTILLVLLLSFVLLQGVIRLAAGKDRLVERMFSTVREMAELQGDWENTSVRRQAMTVIRLGQWSP